MASSDTFLECLNVKIEALYADSRQISPSFRAGQESAEDFAKTLAGAAKEKEALKENPQEKAEKAAEAQRQAAQAAREATRKELDDFLKKSPAEHMRDAILASMGLSEESLAAMPPEQRAAVEEEIGCKIRERMLGKSDEDAGAGKAQHAAATQAVGSAQATGPSPEGMAQLTALRAALASGGGGLEAS